MEVSAVAGRHGLVREKASLIIELLDDDSRLRFERKKAKELKQKLASRQNAVGGGAPASAGPQTRQARPVRPMARGRYDDDEDERPRRRRFEDDDDDERPRNRRRADVSDDDDDYRPKKKPVKKASRYDDDDEEEERPKKKVVKKA